MRTVGDLLLFEYPHGTYDSPHGHYDILTVLSILHGTQESPTVLNTPTVCRVESSDKEIHSNRASSFVLHNFCFFKSGNVYITEVYK